MNLPLQGVNPFAARTQVNESSRAQTSPGNTGEGNRLTVGKSLHELAANGLEEASAFLHKFRKNTDGKQRQKQLRRDYDSATLRKMRDAAFSIDKLQKIEACLKNLRQNSGNPRQQQQYLQKLLDEFNNDKSQQYLALLWLRQEIGISEGQHVARNSVQEQIDTLLKPLDNSQEVAVGMQGYATIAWAGEKGADKAGLRDTFHNHGNTQGLSEFSSMAQAWDNLLEKFGENAFLAGAHAVFEQLSAQYHAAGYHIDNVELMGIMRDMSMLKSMLAIYDQCAEIARLLTPSAARFSDPLAEHTTGLSLFKEVLQLQMKTWVENSDISHIARTLKATGDSVKNVMGVQLKRIMGLVPAHLYSDADQKQQCIEVLNKYLDVAARKESASAQESHSG